MKDGRLFAPKYVENKLKFYPTILEAVLFGAGRDKCTAFINIDLQAVGNWAERNLYGGDGIAFIEDLFEDTHFVVRSYNKQGFVILLPVSKDLGDEAENLIVGSVDE